MGTHQQHRSSTHKNNHKKSSSSSLSTIKLTLVAIASFACGVSLSSIFIFHSTNNNSTTNLSSITNKSSTSIGNSNGFYSSNFIQSSIDNNTTLLSSSTTTSQHSSNSNNNNNNTLAGVRILIAIASYDFNQLPHLEELIDSLQDICYSGAIVHIYIHTTIPYTVALIDLLNTRLYKSSSSHDDDSCTLTIIVQTPALRLNLVDSHRTLFYNNIDNYDLFIYSEDDHRISPTLVATYLEETRKLEEIVGKSPAQDFNVGLVRYEYNYPLDAIIDDKTRDATKNVTRVYWEHVWRPLIPKSISQVPQSILSNHNYVYMNNRHQGMFLATRELLKAWKERPNCNFDVVRQRPGLKNNPGQPAEGTQRVWMSSNMLYGNSHCGVQQVIPIERFGQLTVLHLANKNYRRVGKKGRLGGDGSDIENLFGDGTERYILPSQILPTAMEVHLELRKAFPKTLQNMNTIGEYKGIKMFDDFDWNRSFRGKEEYKIMYEQRMKAYHDYINRGGIMSEDDIQSWNWVYPQ